MNVQDWRLNGLDIDLQKLERAREGEMTWFLDKLYKGEPLEKEDLFELRKMLRDLHTNIAWLRSDLDVLNSRLTNKSWIERVFYS